MAKAAKTISGEAKKAYPFRLDETIIKKLDRIKKAINSQDNNDAEKTRTDIVTDALQEYIARYEKKNGTINI